MINTPSAPSPDSAFWKRKLAAWLHDPPSKAMDIRTHSERSEKVMAAAGLGMKEERRVWGFSADHTAAAADRFPFPDYRKASLSCAFDGVKNQFRHPLNGKDRLPFDGPFISVEQAMEGEQTTQPVLERFEGMTEGGQWRARFFAHWRLWAPNSAQKDWRSAWLPADTRIPDHTIWNHMQMVSALEGCRGADGAQRPAFLKFQLGPVQEFIQAARSTRDLWSGSYLLSWLMARGLATLSLANGPDSVVFPNLRGQPLVDLALKKDLWSRVEMGQRKVWQAADSPHARPGESSGIQWEKEDLLTPNLPNVFLAVVPAEHAESLAKSVCQSIGKEWQDIAESVWKACEEAGLWKLEDHLPKGEERRARFERQIDSFLSLSWSVLPWPETLAEIEILAGSLPRAKTTSGDAQPGGAMTNYQTVKQAAEAIRTLGHHDGRYFDNKGQLRNEGIAWSLLTALSGWQLDAVRQTRAFHANVNPARPGQFNEKDSLNGKEEAIAGGPAWKNRGEFLASRFKHDDHLSAPTLVKRLWDKAYLHNAKPYLEGETEGRWFRDLGPEPQDMPNTRSLAAHKPSEKDADDDLPAEEGERYFAVLAFDGDDIGRWISGEKTPPFGAQLADYAGEGALEYFSRPEHAAQFAGFLCTPRPLSPAYHLQFSECLSNFALRCARPVVEAHDGRLIYAGGDDVVALLPADTVLACARDLHLAFTGRPPLASVIGDRSTPGSSRIEKVIGGRAPGFLTSKALHEVTGKADSTNENLIPFMVPGPQAGASVGITIAHFKSPLQDAVRAAQAAEKRAKKLPGKNAVAVTVMKRSGETVEWAARWEDHGVQAALTLLEALRGEVVSAKFPYRLAELMSAYRTQSAGLMKPMDPVQGFSLTEVFAHELATVLTRQRGPAWDSGGEEFTRIFRKHTEDWLASMLATVTKATSRMDESSSPSGKLDQAISQLIALCAYCGFARRQSSSSAR